MIETILGGIIAVFFLAVMGPTTFLMLCGLTVLASIVMVWMRF